MAFSADRTWATESGVDRRIFGIFIATSTLLFVASGLAVAVSGFGGDGITGTVASMSQPAVFSRTKAGHECREGCHRFRLFLSKVPGEPLVTDIVLEGC